jgi:hypothetical protein
MLYSIWALFYYISVRGISMAPGDILVQITPIKTIVVH